MRNLCLLFCVFCLFFSNGYAASKSEKGKKKAYTSGYAKQKIKTARFGSSAKQELLAKAYALYDTTKKDVIGQDLPIRVLRDRDVQYIESLGSRTNEPVSLHFIGLPGVGKSAILSKLDATGATVVNVDAQILSGDSGEWYFYRVLEDLVSKQKNVKAGLDLPMMPVILFVDELDKVPEVITTNGIGGEKEKTNPSIAILNSILTSGKVYRPGSSKPFDLSNVFVVTAMNFSPEDIEKFSNEVLGEQKSFYDFTVEDFEKFNQWIRKSPASISKILANRFRANTVSRLAPNVVVANALVEENFPEIVRLNVRQTVERLTSGSHNDRRLHVEIADSYYDFLVRTAVYAPSGARDTVFKADFLTEQLINYAMRAIPNYDDPKEAQKSLFVPRRIDISWNKAKNCARIKVTPIKRIGSNLIHFETFVLNVPYEPSVRSFVQPEDLVIIPPKIRNAKETTDKPLSRDQIIEIRFPELSKKAKGLAKSLAQKLVGLDSELEGFEEKFGNFLAVEGEQKPPPAEVFIGLHGNGKTEFALLAAEYAGIPVVRVNLREFSGDHQESVNKLYNILSEEIQTARQGNPKANGKFVLLLEELDKAFEIEPTKGIMRTPPVLSFVNDVLDGVRKLSYLETGGFGGNQIKELDLQGAFPIFTLNFGADWFSFSGDPRLSTIEDVRKKIESLSKYPDDLEDILRRIFRLETYKRMMAHMRVFLPLTREDYKKLIQRQVAEVERTRFRTEKAKVKVTSTFRYRKYLMQEAVVPSSGARYTVQVVKRLVISHIDRAMREIGKRSPFATKTLKVKLDFNESKGVVRILVTSGEKEVARVDEPVSLQFPPLQLKKRQKIDKGRLFTAVHEYGHAIANVILGQRFEHALVVAPKNSIGGMVKFKGDAVSAKSLLARLVISLGSRAMYRVVLSENPLDNSSVFTGDLGPSADIQMATELLWNIIYTLGLDPNGIVLERSGVKHGIPYASFSPLADQKVEKLGAILRDLEDELVRLFLEFNSVDWHVEKITELARAGILYEKEFYDLIGLPDPGESEDSLGENPIFRSRFKTVMAEADKGLAKAELTRMGNTQKTAPELLDKLSETFFKSLDERLRNCSENLRQQSLADPAV
ncbi:MAG: AAA family ATPase [Bacteriovoracia bacterium]